MIVCRMIIYGINLYNIAFVYYLYYNVINFEIVNIILNIFPFFLFDSIYTHIYWVCNNTLTIILLRFTFFFLYTLFIFYFLYEFKSKHLSILSRLIKINIINKKVKTFINIKKRNQLPSIY